MLILSTMLSLAISIYALSIELKYVRVSKVFDFSNLAGITLTSYLLIYCLINLFKILAIWLPYTSWQSSQILMRIITVYAKKIATHSSG